jgi:hypothetical protein
MICSAIKGGSDQNLPVVAAALAESSRRFEPVWAFISLEQAGARLTPVRVGSNLVSTAHPARTSARTFGNLTVRAASLPILIGIQKTR